MRENVDTSFPGLPEFFDVVVPYGIGTIGGIGPKASRSITPTPPMPPMLTTTPAEKDGLPKLSLKILSRLPMA